MIRAAVLMLGLVHVLSCGALAQVPEPEGYRGPPYRAPVPATLTGAEVIGDEAARALWQAGEAVFVDVLPRPPRPENLPEGTIWRDRPRDTIPGAVWLPNTGLEALAPETLAYFRAGLETATEGAAAAPLVFFCQRDCWMSWNAAKRAGELGYSRIAWYPDGTDGWAARGWQLERAEPWQP